jgi:hypothetical protein
MKISTIFRKAAEIYADPKRTASVSGCCMAIGHAEKPKRDVCCYPLSDAQMFFKTVFYLRSRTPCGPWWWWWASPADQAFEEHRTPRVLALLLAAEMAKDEGL